MKSLENYRKALSKQRGYDVGTDEAAQLAFRASGRRRPDDTFDSWAKREGIDKQLAKRPAPQPAPQTDLASRPDVAEERGLIGDIGSRLARGTARTAELAGHALQTLDPEGGIELAQRAGESIVSGTEQARKDWDFLQPDVSEAKGEEGFVERGIKSGIESAPASMTPALVGAAAGSPFGPIGMAVGAGAATLGLFGAGVYGQRRKEAEEKGLSEEKAHKYALTQAAIEGGGETASNLIGAMTFGMGKLATQPLKQTAKELLETPASTLVKQIGKNAAFNEIPTEVLQEGAQAYYDQKYGMSDVSWQEAAKEAIIPAMTMSVLFGLGAETFNSVQKRKLKKKLNSDNPKERIQAANAITNRLKAEHQDNPELADAWVKMAKDRIEKNQDIDLNEDFVAFAEQKRQEEKQDQATEGYQPPEDLQTETDPEKLITGGKETTPEEILSEEDVDSISDETLEKAIQNQQEQRAQEDEFQLPGGNLDYQAQEKVYTNKKEAQREANRLTKEGRRHKVTQVEGGYILQPTGGNAMGQERTPSQKALDKVVDEQSQPEYKTPTQAESKKKPKGKDRLVGKYVRSGSMTGKVAEVSEDGTTATLEDGSSVPVGQAPNWEVSSKPLEPEKVEPIQVEPEKPKGKKVEQETVQAEGTVEPGPATWAQDQAGQGQFETKKEAQKEANRLTKQGKPHGVVQVGDRFDIQPKGKKAEPEAKIEDSGPKPQEPWQMKSQEYAESQATGTPSVVDDRAYQRHKNLVATALKNGELVPQEVLQEYPDLAKEPQHVTKRPRLDGWRDNLLKARQVAKDLEIDSKGKDLNQIVSEIDRVDAGEPTPQVTPQGTQQVAPEESAGEEVGTQKVPDGKSKVPDGTQKVPTVEAKTSYHKTKHMKQGYDLHVIKLDERVDRETFNDLRKKAEGLGGHYSRYNKGQAVPGFQFRDKAKAEEFARQNFKNPPAELTAEQEAKPAEEKPQEKARAKEPWEMTREEWTAVAPDEVEWMGERYVLERNRKVPKYVQQNVSRKTATEIPPHTYHYARVKQALSEGKPVPQEVLAKYPDLQEGTQEEAKPQKSEYGANNKLVSQDRYEELKKRMQEKLNRLHMGFDPEFLSLGTEMAAFHVEAGARKFKDFSQRMVADLGEKVKPYLKSFYKGARMMPGMEELQKDMDTDQAVDAFDLDSLGEGVEATTETGYTEGQETSQTEETGDEAVTTGDEGPEALGGVSAQGGSEATRRGESEKGPGRGSRKGDRGNDRDRGPAPGAAPEEEFEGLPGEGSAGERDQAAGEGDRSSEVHPPATREPRDYRFPDDVTESIGRGGVVTRARNNLEAIKTLKKIEQEQREATPEEKATLAKYIGWGGMPQVFTYATDLSAEERSSMAKIRNELRELLTDEEYDAARASTQNAHYTSPEIINQIWAAMKRMGFSGGRVLEPGSGIGLFRGLMPKAMFNKTSYTGVERDSISGRISAALHPKSNIKVQPFEDVQLPDNFFDAAVSNVPFANVQPYDPSGRYKKYSFSLHDFFFAKSIDKVRPGGVVAFITSRYTMDKKDPLFRDYMNERAEFLGAIRLPNTAFKKFAGTEVTTDIIFLRKKAPGQKDKGKAWKQSKEFTGKDGGEMFVNEYFAENPDMMMGEMALTGSMYGSNEPTLEPGDKPLQEALDEAVNKLPAKALKPREGKQANTEKLVDKAIPAPDEYKEGNLAVHDGKVAVKLDGVLQDAEIPAKDKGRVKAMIGIRDKLREVLRTQYQNAPEEEIAKARQDLNKVYDSFVKKYGPLNAKQNKNAFKEDVDATKLLALESYDSDTGTAEKEAIFTKRTVQRPEPVTSVPDSQSALKVSLNERGGVDLEHMAKISSMPQDQLVEELQDFIFKNPETEAWEPRDIYLSGNVKQKLAAAKEAAQIDSAYERNVKELEKVQPEDLTATQIAPRLGAPWVPPETVAEFVNHLLDTRHTRVVHEAKTAQWTVNVSAQAKNSVLNNQTWGLDRQNGTAEKLIEAALNQRTPTIRSYDPETKSRKPDPALTERAADKQRAIRKEFERWAWDDVDRREMLLRIYNDTHNTDVERSYDGSHLTFPGSNPQIQLRDNQRNAAWRIIQDGRGLLHHVVGAGKTWTMVAAGMEMKRLGLAKKPMYVVPNHMVNQFSKEFLELYSTANILTLGPEEVKAENRKRTASRIATGDWDAVVVRESAFVRIPVSPEYETKFVEAQIKELEWAIRQMEEQEGGTKKGKSLVKRLEAIKDRKEARLKELSNRESKDQQITFEELGVDFMFVDEAHNFKNLEFQTKMQVAGLGQRQDVQKTLDMLMKVRYMQELHGGDKGVVFATGTPISNSIAEMYIQMRYLIPSELEAKGINHFDGWAATFAEAEKEWEWSIDNKGYTERTRFRTFINIGDLAQLYRKFADVIMPEDLPNVKLPKIKGGKPELVTIEPTDELLQLNDWCATNLEAWKKDPFENPQGNPLNITTLGRKAAIDMRLVDPSYTDDPNNKLNTAIRKIHEIWERTKADSLTQIVWLDMGVPGGSTINLYKEIREKLQRLGVPKEEVAFISEYPKDEQKDVLFKRVRQGQIRVLIGSTQKMGTGMNVQKRLKAAHHINPDWRPADMEQRDGRIVRQGNMNDEVEVYRYSTERTFDTFFWQTLETKAGYIGQILKAGRDTRFAEDVDAVRADYAEAMAITSGDPLAREFIKAEADARKLRRLEMGWRDNKFKSESKAKLIREQAIPTITKNIENLKEDLDKVEDISGKKFSITIEGTTYTDRKEANEALQDIIADMETKAGLQNRTIGTLAGLTVRAEQKDKMMGPTLAVVGKNVYGLGSVSSDQDLVRMLSDRIRRLDTQLHSQEQDLESAKKELEQLEAEAKKPFEHAEELKKAEQHLQDVEQQIRSRDQGGQAAQPQEMPEGVQSFGERPDFKVTAASIEGTAAKGGYRQVQFHDHVGWASNHTVLFDKPELKGMDLSEVPEENRHDLGVSIGEVEDFDTEVQPTAVMEREDEAGSGKYGLVILESGDRVTALDRAIVEYLERNYPGGTYKVQGKGKESGPVMFLHDGELKAITMPIQGAPENYREKMGRTDQPTYRRAESPTGKRLKRETVQKNVDTLTAGLATDRLPKINVYQSESELPQAIQNDMAKRQAQGDVEAAWWNGELHFISDNLGSPSRVERALVHELFGHVGPEAILGDRADNFYMRVFLDKQKEARQVAQDYGLDLKNRADKIAAGKEVVARMAEIGQENKILDRIIAAIKDALRRAGFTFSISDAEIRQLIARGKGQLQGRQAATARPGIEAAAFRQQEPAFYSQMQRVLNNKLPKKGTPASYKAMMQSWATKGQFKQEELEWSGVETWLDDQDGKITKDQVLDYLQANQIQVQEVTKAKPTETKYEEYQLPEGENYKELLLTLPEGRDWKRFNELADKGIAGRTKADNEEYRQLGMKGFDRYKSQHWDESNVLAHVRFNERTDPQGNPVLFVEEIQSDWHQEGRKRGYGKINKSKATARKIKEVTGPKFEVLDLDHDTRTGLYDSESEARNEAERLGHEHGDETRFRHYSVLPVNRYEVSDGTKTVEIEAHGPQAAITKAVEREIAVPDAPFKSSWPLLVMKRMIRYAAENGFNKVAWTTGLQQADRWRQTQEVDEIEFDKVGSQPKYINIRAWNMGERAYTKRRVQPEELGKLVGDKLAKRVLDSDKRRIRARVNIKIGGEGMKGFYDDILPKTLNKYTKKWGAKAQPDKISLNPWLDTTSEFDQIIAETGSEDAWSVPITDKMKASVMEGQPLFRREQEGGTPAYRRTPPTREIDTSGILSETVRKRVQDAAGKRSETLWEKAKAMGQRIFEERKSPVEKYLDKTKDAKLIEDLRQHRGHPRYANWKAWDKIREFLSPIQKYGEKGKEVFSMNLLLADMAKDLEPNPETGKPLLSEEDGLPFGFETADEVRQAYQEYKNLADYYPEIGEALRKRNEYMTDLKKQMVKAKILKKSVLDDPAYFHHQVLEYLNAKNGPTAATGSKDVRNHWRGWMAARKGSAKDYNTEYAEAEFEVLSQSIEQLETWKTLQKVKKDYNVLPSLKQQAKQENAQNLRDKLEAEGRLEWDNKKQTYKDPLQDYKQKMAIAFSNLGKMAENGELEYSDEWSDVVEDLISGGGMDQYNVDAPNPDLSLMNFLNYLLTKEKPGANWAATVFKAMKERNQFIKAELGENFLEWRDILSRDMPEHTTWRPKAGTVWYKTFGVADRLIDQMMEQGQAEFTAQDLQEVKALIPGETWVIPERVATQLDNMKSQMDEGPIGRASARALSMWKQWVLLNPYRLVKYNLNNISGDMDITLAYAPEIGRKKYLWQAAKDLVKFHRGGEMDHTLKNELDEALYKDVLDSGLTVYEIDDLSEAIANEKYLRDLIGGRKEGILKNGISRYWNGVKNFTRWRENILRLAAYRFFKEQWRQGNQLYGASNPQMIDQISNIEDKAARLSRELVGDYGNISEAGEFLRKRMIPFWSWMEINAPRYVKLFRNLKDEGGGGRAAGLVAWKGSKLALKASSLMIAVQLFNHLVHGDEEDELKEYERRQMHLILGRREDGSIITMRFQGALSDALSWFGAEDLPQDIKDLTSGQATIEEKLAEAAKATPTKMIHGLRPEPKMLYESLTQTSLYPDPFSGGRPIRDVPAHILKTFSLDSIYERVMGKPQKADTWEKAFWNDIQDLVLYKTDPGEAAYYNIKKQIFDFLDKEGIERPSPKPTSRGNALYYYRQALKYGDIPAAAKYRKKYFDLGGTYRGLKTSIKRAHPLAGLPKRLRFKFRSQLTPEQEQTLQRGLEWYHRTYR